MRVVIVCFAGSAVVKMREATKKQLDLQEVLFSKMVVRSEPALHKHLQHAVQVTTHYLLTFSRGHSAVFTPPSSPPPPTSGGCGGAIKCMASSAFHAYVLVGGDPYHVYLCFAPTHLCFPPTHPNPPVQDAGVVGWGAIQLKLWPTLPPLCPPIFLLAWCPTQ